SIHLVLAETYQMGSPGGLSATGGYYRWTLGVGRLGAATYPRARFGLPGALLPGGPYLTGVWHRLYPQEPWKNPPARWGEKQHPGLANYRRPPLPRSGAKKPGGQLELTTRF